MIIVIVILAVLVGLLSYLLYINFKRAEVATGYCETYIRFVSTMYLRFKNTKDKMKEIDRIGAFSADDEVGTVFKALDQQIIELYEFITKYVDQQDPEKTKD